MVLLYRGMMMLIFQCSVRSMLNFKMLVKGIWIKKDFIFKI